MNTSSLLCVPQHVSLKHSLYGILQRDSRELLVMFFTFVGSPKSVQSDQGSNLMAGVFQKKMHDCCCCVFILRQR